MTDKQSVKDRLKIFIKYKDLSVRKFETQVGLVNGYINAMRKGLGVEKLNLILSKFPDLNRDWLIYGEGEMLNEDLSQIQVEEDELLYRLPPEEYFAPKNKNHLKDEVHTTLSMHDIDEQSKKELNPTIEELIDIITTNTKTIDRLTRIIETLSSKI